MFMGGFFTQLLWSLTRSRVIFDLIATQTGHLTRQSSSVQDKPRCVNWTNTGRAASCKVWNGIVEWNGFLEWNIK